MYSYFSIHSTIYIRKYESRFSNNWRKLSRIFNYTSHPLTCWVYSILKKNLHAAISFTETSTNMHISFSSSSLFCKNNIQLYRRSETDFDPFLLDHFRWRSSLPIEITYFRRCPALFFPLYISRRVHSIFLHFLSCIIEQINGNTFLSAVIFDRLRVMHIVTLRAMYRVSLVIWICFKTFLIL